MPQFIGLDLHKQVLQACVLDASGAVRARVRLPVERTAILAFARAYLRPTDRLAVEATTNTWALVRLLEPHVAEVVVSNPLRTRAIAAAKIKTDRVDAETLAQLLRADYLPRVWQPDAQTAQLRHLTSRRAALVRQRAASENRLHAVLHQRLIKTPQASCSAPLAAAGSTSSVPRPCWRPWATSAASGTATTPPATWGWCPRPASRPPTAPTARSPRLATARPAGC